MEKEQREKLIRLALEMVPASYSPYSHFRVGAAVLCDSGRIYTGANVENSSYPAGVCAEHNAIIHAVAQGERRIRAVAIAGGLNGVVEDYCSPCGLCRQVMREFADPKELTVILAKSTEEYRELTLEELLPMSFGPEDLA